MLAGARCTPRPPRAPTRARRGVSRLSRSPSHAPLPASAPSWNIRTRASVSCRMFGGRRLFRQTGRSPLAPRHGPRGGLSLYTSPAPLQRNLKGWWHQCGQSPVVLQRHRGRWRSTPACPAPAPAQWRARNTPATCPHARARLDDWMRGLATFHAQRGAARHLLGHPLPGGCMKPFGGALTTASNDWGPPGAPFCPLTTAPWPAGEFLPACTKGLQWHQNSWMKPRC